MARRRTGGPLALALLALPMLHGLAAAQQPAPAAPAWQQGRPSGMAASPLAPNAPRLTVTPPDRIPVAQIRVPDGFRVEVWASGMPGARMMALSENGTLFVGTRTIGRVYAVTQQDGQRRVRTLLQGLTEPNGVAVRDGALYVAAINRVLRYDNIDRSLDEPKPVELTGNFNLPTDAHHGWKFLRFGPDGKLYLQVGANCNICRVDDRHATIERYNPDGSGREVVAHGVRNSVGFDFHPVTGELWFTNNGRDWAGDNTPEDTLGHVRRVGEHFGFPWCHMGTMQDPEVTGRQCSEFSQPALRLGPHTAALGMRFYTGGMFPAEYRNRIFIARHGSWNRTQRSGYDVVMVSFDANGQPRMEPFMTGLLDGANNQFLGRPTDVQQLPDGSLLVSDEQNGAIYRIAYGR
ncbi:PQQ-dependent sugar dehydrogenase [Roseomonas sp. NAR14]|uniref:PQQ-dependent sugar dehydrogenase n=1 Tax=Roseomonas acroporae TaxID=2937791 RepID=A0A9X1Y2Y3_9PROT|nr:PQQ-dependent sugar dehydrogenase [Roseomonas acroporae]MCK8782964.1 PQQ-dependent sugar dehydrogenase [Roseomonas acroporae]